MKKIQVLGVTERDNFNQPYLALQSITTQKGITAKLRTYASQKGTTREADITVKHGDDLYTKTGREEHRGGYRIVEINAGNGFVLFENGVRVSLDNTIGPSRTEIFRTQIEQTIDQHITMQEALHSKGVKVLSLFFIDRVANYIEADGIVKQLFDQVFEKRKMNSSHFAHRTADQVREAYFAQRTTKGQTEVIDTNGSNNAEREAEKVAFALIMRDKERLLSFDEPVCFIFAHSALREGWDNPNVFQICTLNQSISEIKKRQEIGRGMRLCVDQDGERLTDDEVNVLTIVANESYASYAAGLQQEYVGDGDAPPPPPTDPRKTWAKRNDEIFHRNDEFRAFWKKLLRRVSYRIKVDTAALIEKCVERLNNQTFPAPMLVIEKGTFAQTTYQITVKAVRQNQAHLSIHIQTSEDEAFSKTTWVQAKANLADIVEDQRLRGYKVAAIVEDGDNSCVEFENNDTILVQETHTFQCEAGQRPRERATYSPTTTYPVFNLLQRTSQETGLTQPTINAIFKRMKDAHKHMLFRNPEGFAGVFIGEIRNALADHVAERIEFVLDHEFSLYDLEALFPPQRRYPQRELVPTNERGLYNQVQKDSGEEETFIEQLTSDKQIIFSFKFPPAFKIPLPKIIGNYNPDWGIARYDDNGTVVLHLVRETKGSVEMQALRFPHEKRKIVCAKKHFAILTLDYRVITGDTPSWWRSAEEVGIQEELVI